MVDKKAISRIANNERETGTPTKPEGWTDSAFEQVFLQYYTRLVALVFQMVGDRAKAEELVDDVFLKLYKHPRLIDHEHNLGGWLFRTAMRQGIDALRATSRRTHYEQAAASSAIHDASAGNPLGDLLRAEKRYRVRVILSHLKPVQAQLLIMRNSGFSYKELAQALGLRTSSVGTMLARAEAEFEKRYREVYRDKE